MIRYLYGDDLARFPQLAHSMFCDRAHQFKYRQGWDVSVNDHGEERDEYDALNPLYVIWQRPDGNHGGSMRFLPTTGQTMVNDHFLALMDGQPVCSPTIWECTRFCLAQGASSNIAAALMLAGGEVMRGFDIAHFVGVFDAPMARIYRAIGSAPEILGASGHGAARISVGLWAFSDEARQRVAARAGISLDISTLWFRRAFASTQKVPVPA